MSKVKDLFEDFNNIPLVLQPILQVDNAKVWDSPSYSDLEKMKLEVEKHGYTFDYGLDATAYGLRVIGTELEELEGF
jgi:hypothetical protein